MRHTAKTLLCLLALLTLPSLTTAQQSTEALLDDKLCYACHQPSSASIGPPWQAIAARHAQRKELMRKVLAIKIVEGGGGNWGQVPMVPNQRVSRDEALRMADWILAQAPAAAGED